MVLRVGLPVHDTKHLQNNRSSQNDLQDRLFLEFNELADIQVRVSIVVLLTTVLLIMRFLICQLRELSRFNLARLALD